MATSTRVKKVEQGLSVKQIVLLLIQESHQYPTMIAHAMALASAGCTPTETLCDRIEAAVEQANRGLASAAKNRLIRGAQRDGLFLGRLALECNTRLLASARERQFEIALLYAWVVICARDPDEESAAEKLGPWVEVGNALLLSLQAELEAVRLIEREYFDGTKILYHGEEQELVGRVQEVRALLDKLSGAVVREGAGSEKQRERPRRPRAEPPSGDGGDVRLAAQREAASLVLAAKVKVLDEFSQSREAATVLTRHLNAYGLEGTGRVVPQAGQHRADVRPRGRERSGGERIQP